MIVRRHSVEYDPARREELLREALPCVREGGEVVIVGSDGAPPPRVAVFDLDATLIPCEFVDLVARRRGVDHLTRELTALAMSGGIDFRTSFLRRMEILAGTPVSLVDELIRAVPVAPGAAEAIAALRRAGIHTAIVTGGSARLGRAVQRRLGIDALWATELEERDGVLTGRVSGRLLDEEGKVRALREFCAAVSGPDGGITPRDALAVGDGANDLKMLAHAGRAILYTSAPHPDRETPSLDRIVGIGPKG
jgi:phosphoserine phosphatase